MFVRVILKKDIGDLVHSFNSRYNSFIYTGSLCKEMVTCMKESEKVTDIVHAVSSVDMMEEYVECVHVEDVTVRVVKRLMRHAAVRGEVKCIRKIHEFYELANGKKFDWGHSPIAQSQIFDYVAGKGDLETMMFLQDIGCRKGNRTLDNAVRSGNKYAVFWAWFNGCSKRTRYTYDIAEKSGVKDIVAFLYDDEYRKKFNRHTCRMSIQHINTSLEHWDSEN